MKNMTLLQETASSTEGFIKCDVCPARAIHKATFVAGPLYFCNHHFQANQAVITLVAIQSNLLGQEA
jgi:hypothetical protein